MFQHKEESLCFLAERTNPQRVSTIVVRRDIALSSVPSLGDDRVDSAILSYLLCCKRQLLVVPIHLAQTLFSESDEFDSALELLVKDKVAYRTLIKRNPAQILVSHQDIQNIPVDTVISIFF